MPDTWPPTPLSPPTAPPAPPSRPAPAATPPPQPSRGRVIAGALAGVLIVLVLAVTAGLALNEDDEPSSSTPVTTEREPSSGSAPPSQAPSTTAPTDLDAAIDELMAFVEEERGRSFVTRPPVETLDDAAFIDRYNALIDEAVAEDPAAIEAATVVYRALGLIGPDEDIVEVERAFGAAGVLGFYDTKRNELVVRAGEITPFARVVLVHELAHALDDQLFELYRPEYDDAPDESGFGLAAVAEGNARRVENAYRATLSDDELRDAEREEARYGADLSLDNFTVSYLMLQVAPYQYGERFVEELLASGGEDAVDAALVQPPRTSEQVIDFDKYQSREPRLDVPAPGAPAPVIDEGVVGQVAIEAVLAGVIGFAAGSEAADGWAGDWFQAWREGAASCIRASFLMETAHDRAELLDALTEWAAQQPDATVDELDDQLTLTSCVQ